MASQFAGVAEDQLGGVPGRGQAWSLSRPHLAHSDLGQRASSLWAPGSSGTQQHDPFSRKADGWVQAKPSRTCFNLKSGLKKTSPEHSEATVSGKVSKLCLRLLGSLPSPSWKGRKGWVERLLGG